MKQKKLNSMDQLHKEIEVLRALLFCLNENLITQLKNGSVKDADITVSDIVKVKKAIYDLIRARNEAKKL
jgi:hypothetical protein